MPTTTSVHPAGIGGWVLVRADSDRVQVFCDVATDHQQIWAAHQTISDPTHVANETVSPQQDQRGTIDSL